MKNIKLFTNHSEYEQYINSAGKILPNVSYCLDARDVHYNEEEANTVLRAVYHAGNIKSTMETVQLYTYIPEYGVYGSMMFSSAVINGVEVSAQDLDNNNGQYDFESGTDNVVEFNILDPTLVGAIFEGSQLDRIGMTFSDCDRVTSVEIPNTVTTIGVNAFMTCPMLSDITLPSGVTEIYEGAFFQCGADITCLPTTPPILHGTQFPEYNIIYVPAESLNAYKTTVGWSEHAEDIFPIEDENSGVPER